VNRPRLMFSALLWGALPVSVPAVANQWTVTPRNSVEIQSGGLVEVEELSGVTYIGPANGGLERFAAIQDQDGVVVTFDVGFAADASVQSATQISRTTLEDPLLDYEGIAFTDATSNSVFVSFERDTGVSSPVIPGVSEYSLSDGSQLGTTSLPTVWTTDGNTRRNLGFESLTMASGGMTLWTENEEALTIDGPVATPLTGTPVRLQQLNRSGSNVAAGPQFVYEVDPLHGPCTFGQPATAEACADDSRRSGLVDLVALPNDTLLALERSTAETLPIFENRIYQVDFGGATDVSTSGFTSGLDGKTYTPVSKTLLWSGAAQGFFGANMEGLGLGPQLANGHWTLVGVTDDGGTVGDDFLVAFELVAPTPSCDVDGDFDCSGQVEVGDLNLVLFNWNRTPANSLWNGSTRHPRLALPWEPTN